jgi:hypothetical protein
MARCATPAVEHPIVIFFTSTMHLSKRFKSSKKLDDYQVRRLKRPPYSPDLAPCDFFLFGYLHEKMQLLRYDTVDELQEAITSTIDGIPKAKLIQVFQTWRRGLEKCIQQEGGDFE